jgi:hypothetical protein
MRKGYDKSKMAGAWKIVILLALVSFAHGLVAQNNVPGKKSGNNKPVRDTSGDVLAQTFPLYYFPRGTDTSEQVRVTGKVLQVSSPGFYCGAFCQSGTAKIEVISTSDKIYTEKTIYVLIGCFMPEKDMVGKKVEFLLNRMTDKMNIGCYKESCFNILDSKGKPFYYCINYW